MNALSILVSFIVGLIGVVVGVLLNYVKERAIQRQKDARDRVLLAALVAARLEHFAVDCLDVAMDEGEQDTETGVNETSIKAPSLDYLDLNVEWKVIDDGLLLDVLDLPHRLDLARAMVSNSYEFDFAPDYEAFFHTRQVQYALLGKDACTYARQLRTVAELPERHTHKDADLTAGLEKRIGELEAQRIAREARNTDDL